MLWKMTLNGLYDYGQLRNDDLFEDMILPDHLDKEVVLNSILIECGELPVMWADYPFLKNQIRKRQLLIMSYTSRSICWKKIP